jgi:hypothetical protein
MQTLHFTRTLREIVMELKVAELIGILTPFVTTGGNNPIAEGVKDQFSTLLFGSHAGFERLAQNATASKILSSLKVNAIYEPARMGKLLSTVQVGGNYQNIWGNPTSFAEFYSFLDSLRSLADLEKTCSELLEAERVGKVAASDGILELLLIDHEGMAITPNRLAVFISGITKLHTDLALIHGVSGDQLRFTYFDSGSDLVVGIQCAKIIVESLKTLLGEWWDKIKFRSFDKFDKKMDAVSKSLTVMESVQEAVNKNVINQETGDLLKTHVLIEVDRLVGIGATLPLQEEEEKIDQRELLLEHRDMKLLGSGEGVESDGSPPASTQQ